MSRKWGFLCPDGHGLLITREEWDRKGVMWCPHEDHGGNGRFWRANEAQEGWFDPSAPIVKTQAQIEREALALQRTQEWDAERTARQRREKEARRMTTDTTGTTKTPRAAKTPQECLCGCKGLTKGGRFLPGHDARYHAAIKREQAAAEAKANPTPEPIKTAKARVQKAKAPDLTSRATDEPSVSTEEGDIAIG